MDGEIFEILFEQGRSAGRTAKRDRVIDARGSAERACCALHGELVTCADRVFRIVVPDS
jgi:hypothetical protein